jgi:ABC-type transport system involved in multi-copper enzyme maturation permease subunit
MRKILRLEYLFNRKQVLIVLAIFTAYFAYMVYQIDSPRVFVVATSVMIGLTMPLAILGREDKFKTAALVCSLPVRRTTVVLGKYAVTWAAIGFGLGYALLFKAVFPFSKFSIGEILTARNLLVSFFLISLIFAVILPFTIRFGLTGIIILLVGSQLLGILALLLAQLLGGAKNPMRIFFRAVETGLRSLLTREATPGFLLTLLAAFIAVNAASLFISRILYSRRDL